MIRAAVLFVLLVALSLGVAWLADHPGHVTVFWLGYRIDTSFAALAGAAALLAVVSGVLWRSWGAVRNAVRRTGAAYAERRRHRGYRALTRGFVAVAAGDPDEARRQAERADVLLAEPPLTLLLSAQAAQLTGDQEAARKYFTAMLEKEDTAFLGLRGLINQAMRDRDREQALSLARRAYQIRPKTPWLVAILAELEAQAGLWEEAALVLHRARRRGIGADGKRGEAVALVGQSERADFEGREGESIELLRRAHKLAPDLVPVSARLAARLALRGDKRRARKIIESAWAASPHPDLARSFAKIVPGEDALGRLQRTARLAKLRPDHAESHIAIAEAALDAELWGEARRHLRLALLAPKPGRRVFRLMAKLEEEENDDAPAARQWLARAAEAEPDPAWVCRRCAAPAADWRPLCPSCEAFDGLSWTAPARPGLSAPAVPIAADVPAPLAGPP
jgi:HemY protein